jgi:hypothetical protein
MDISSAPTVIDRAPTYNVKRRDAGLVTIVEKEREWRAQPHTWDGRAVDMIDAGKRKAAELAKQF